MTDESRSAAEAGPGSACGQRQVLHEGQFVRLVKQGRWEFTERTNCRDAVNIVAVTPAGELLLVEQFRPAVSAPVVELPAGLVGDQDPNEDAAEAAQRELLEETGYRADTMRYLFGGPPTAGLASEQIHFYRAEGLERVHAGGGDETEQITVHVVPLAHIHAWIADCVGRGVMLDPKVYAGLYVAADMLESA